MHRYRNVPTASDSWLARVSKIGDYESPYYVEGIILPTGLKSAPKSICTDKSIGTRKGIKVK